MFSVDRDCDSRLISVGTQVIIIAIFTIILTTPAASGYEPFFYGVYPSFFWVLIAAGFILSITILLVHAFDLNTDQGFWEVGLFSILILDAILLFLPTIRRYEILGRGDVMTHIGHMRVIEETGTTGDLFYPALHMLGNTISFSTGLDYEPVVNTFPAILSLFSILSVIALVNQTFEEDRKLFILAFGSLLVITGGDLNFAPWAQSTKFIPFLLYLYFKYMEFPLAKLFLVTVIPVLTTIIFHPLTTFFLVIIFGIGGIYERTVRRSTVAFKLIGVTSIGFGAWYFSFYGILQIFSQFITNILYRSGESDLEEYSQVVSRTSPELIDLITVAIFRYGEVLIVTGLAGLCVLLIANQYRRGSEPIGLQTKVFISSFFIFGTFATVFFLFDTIVSFGRPLNLEKFFAVLLAGLFFGLAFSNPLPTYIRKFAKFLLFVSVVSLVLLSTFGMYSSQFSRSHSAQVTVMEIEGNNWVFEHRNPTRKILAFGTNPRRFHDRVFGPRSSGEIIQNVRRPPDHFGYSGNDEFGSFYPNTSWRYVIITERGRIFYPSVYPDYRSSWRFTPSDFKRLEKDPSVYHIYNNNEFDVYAVRSVNSTGLKSSESLRKVTDPKESIRWSRPN